MGIFVRVSLYFLQVSNISLFYAMQAHGNPHLQQPMPPLLKMLSSGSYLSKKNYYFLKLPYIGVVYAKHEKSRV